MINKAWLYIITILLFSGMAFATITSTSNIVTNSTVMIENPNLEGYCDSSSSNATALVHYNYAWYVNNTLLVADTTVGINSYIQGVSVNVANISGFINLKKEKIHYKFNGDATDSSENGLNGIETNIGYDGFGKIGNSLHLLAPNSYVRVPYLTYKNNYATGYSIAYWVYGNMGGGFYPYSEGAYSYVHTYFGMFHSLQSVGTEIKDNAGNILMTAFSTTTSSNFVWHHVVFTDNNGVAKLYIDGTLDATDFSYVPSAVSNINESEIGCFVASRGSCFGGYIDDFRVYNYVLTQSDINFIYNSTVGTETSLINLSYVSSGNYTLSCQAKDINGTDVSSWANYSQVITQNYPHLVYNYSIDSINNESSIIRVNATCTSDYFGDLLYDISYDDICTSSGHLVNENYPSGYLYENTSTIFNNNCPFIGGISLICRDNVNFEDDSELLAVPFFNVTFWDFTSILNFTIYYKCWTSPPDYNFDFYVNGVSQKSYNLVCDGIMNQINDTYDNYYKGLYVVDYVMSFNPAIFRSYDYNRVFNYNVPSDNSSSSVPLFDVVENGAVNEGFGSKEIAILCLFAFLIIMMFAVGVPKEFILLSLLPMAFVYSQVIGGVTWIFITLLLILGFLFAIALIKLFGQQY